jgi:hypothetical protein
MEIIKALKAEQKVLQKKLRAIQVSLKTALEKFHKEEAKKISAMNNERKGANKKSRHKIRKTASLKPSPRRAPVKSVARKAMPPNQKSTAKSVPA